MAGSDENNSRGMIGLSNLQGSLLGGGSKVMAEIGQNRRALSSIDHNIIRPHPYPSTNQKRGLIEEKNVFNKDGQLIPAHRPITRNFAAQIANKKQLVPEVTEIPAQIDQPSKESEDCTIIDAEDGEFPVPMFVQHTEAMLEEIDRMDEVEMKDIYEDPVEDIDSFDKNNSLAVVEYLEDLFSHYRNAEVSNCVSPGYMARQSDINERMRGILVDWLIEVHYKFELMDETLYLTVNLIDRFLSIQPVVRKKLQLVGVTAMLLACKYEEVSVPVVDDLILISDKAYSRKEILEMEKLMVNSLQFHMSVPTPYVFMRRFLKASQSHQKIELLSFFMVELCLVEYEMIKFHPSLLAAAAIFTAQCALNGFQQWSKTSEWYTGYSEEQLLECSMKMVAFHQKAGTGKLTGVHRKYSTANFGYAARIEPAKFLLEERF